MRSDFSRMVRRSKAILSLSVAAAFGASSPPARAQGPTADFPTAFARAYAGAEACVVLRDIAPGAQPAVSDEAACGERLPPCAVFEIAANVVALDRGLVPDADAPIRREPAQGVGDGRPEQASLRDAFRRPVPWVYEEIARRIGREAFGRSLAALRYGSADMSEGPVERMWLGESVGGVRVSAVEQVDFLARLKRGELPTSAESQARSVEVISFDRTPEGLVAWKSGQCGPAGGPKVAWAVGWVDRGQRSTIFAGVEKGAEGVTGDDAVARMRALLKDLALIPQSGG